MPKKQQFVNNSNSHYHVNNMTLSKARSTTILQPVHKSDKLVKGGIKDRYTFPVTAQNKICASSQSSHAQLSNKAANSRFRIVRSVGVTDSKVKRVESHKSQNCHQKLNVLSKYKLVKAPNGAPNSTAPLQKVASVPTAAKCDVSHQNNKSSVQTTSGIVKTPTTHIRKKSHSEVHKTQTFKVLKASRFKLVKKPLTPQDEKSVTFQNSTAKGYVNASRFKLVKENISHLDISSKRSSPVATITQASRYKLVKRAISQANKSPGYNLSRGSVSSVTKSSRFKLVKRTFPQSPKPWQFKQGTKRPSVPYYNTGFMTKRFSKDFRKKFYASPQVFRKHNPGRRNSWQKHR